jgi:uncharacterized integral membrane protein
MANRVLLVLVLIPLAVVMIALAVANRGSTAFTADPFKPGNPALTFSAPLFIWLFAALALGMIIGSMVTWFKQGRYRKQARQRAIEVEAARSARPSSAPSLPRPTA